MNSSIRKRLTFWLMPVLLLTGTAFAVPTWLNVHEEIDELFDKVLLDAAYALSHANYAQGVKPDSNDLALHGDGIDLVSQIRDSEGRILFQSHPFSPIPQVGKPGYDTVNWQNQAWRVVNLKTDKGLVQVAQALQERRETANEITLHVLTPLLILLPALTLWVGWAIGRGLAPLAQVADAVAHRNPHSLDPIPDKGLPAEVSILVGALNGLLNQLNQALSAQRQFTADAAHELRSPLTALSLQAQLAERATEPDRRALALQTLRQGIARASHLVQQLLTLARLDPEAGDSPFKPLFLDDLARDVVADFAPLAANRHIDLGLSRADHVRVTGAEEALRILLGNLIDNAIRYSPADAHIDISVIGDTKTVSLEVNDTGPGIALDERDRVFDRFYRVLHSAESGSGLGLAIAKRIAEQHQADITLSDGDGGMGLKVIVTFPENRA
ncbi:histidine kinase [Methylomonas sp. LW13]|uniref:ATP-binding protein n=1 Tax=unclassified Methylomonas TaxID=2608980 RepID=UPI00051C21D4|nr:ATP-binding protein [Methylomonas sp. LW13]QBC26132.1 histidine kinase [Methylomonas sp. LW13]